MARYIGPVCRLCRREGEKLFLKGERCFSSKCAVERREGQPGQHVKARGKFSEYKVQLREKQKVKRMYGLLERQFRGLFDKASRLKGVTGEQLLTMLEGRLDNLCYRAGFAASRKEARQLVRHGHILVNGRRIDIPSYQVKAGDLLIVDEKARNGVRINDSLNSAVSRKIPEWIELSRESYTAKVLSLPNRTQLTHPMREQLIVELYSK
jgi:small subunit ribosomal protein S4